MQLKRSSQFGYFLYVQQLNSIWNIPSVIKNCSKIDSEKGIIGFAPGAFHFTKRWPLEYYEELGNQLISEGYQIAIFGGKLDREICNELQNIKILLRFYAK